MTLRNLTDAQRKVLSVAARGGNVNMSKLHADPDWIASADGDQVDIVEFCALLDSNYLTPRDTRGGPNAGLTHFDITPAGVALLQGQEPR